MSAQPTVVTIVRPCPWLAINDRDHWAVRAARTKRWRQAAAVYARSAAPVDGPVEVYAAIHKANRQAYDLDGTAATVKACIDGLRDAGVISADDRKTVTAIHLRDGGPQPPGQVVLTIVPTSKES